MKKKTMLFLASALSASAFLMIVATRPAKTEMNTNKTPTPEVTAEERKVAYLNKDAELTDIKREKGKVNIYMFWGNGCPHCKAQWETLEAMRKKYPNDFNVYGFEVWYNHGNLELLKEFAAARGDEVNSVPYTIIGDQGFVGAQGEEALKDAIDEFKNQGIDIYFDKIK